MTRFFLNVVGTIILGLACFLSNSARASDGPVFAERDRYNAYEVSGYITNVTWSSGVELHVMDPNGYRWRVRNCDRKDWEFDALYFMLQALNYKDGRQVRVQFDKETFCLRRILNVGDVRTVTAPDFVERLHESGDIAHLPQNAPRAGRLRSNDNPNGLITPGNLSEVVDPNIVQVAPQGRAGDGILNETVRDSIRTAPRVGVPAVMGTPFERTCRPGELLIAVSGRATGAGIVRIAIKCARVNAQGMRVDDGHWRGAEGGEDGEYFVSPCQDGFVLSGLGQMKQSRTQLTQFAAQCSRYGARGAARVELDPVGSSVGEDMDGSSCGRKGARGISGRASDVVHTLGLICASE